MDDRELKKIFSKNLIGYIERSGKTQKDVADAIGVLPTTFNMWCTGSALPRMGKVQLLADYFHINKSDLLEVHNASDSEQIDRLSAYFAEFLKDRPEFIPVIAQIMDLPTDQADTAARVLRALKDGGEK